jgi:hypothetical protein
MKSVKQQYIDLQEGKMSQQNFMRNLRMTMPQYVTNITSFKDSVRILKNKGILSEADTAEGKWKTVTGKDLYAHFKEIDNLNGQEVLIGIDYEMQKNHDLTKSEATKIVIKNLKKNQFYYTDSLISGVEGYEPGYIGGKSANAEARQMQPLEKNMSNVVDKKMGMQPVKGIEKPKKDSDKGGETNKVEKGISLMSLVAKTVRGVKKMDATGEKMKKITMKEEKMPFQDLPADAKYNIKKDSAGKIVQATNDEGDVFSKNDEAIAIDNGQKIKINSFIEQQGKVKAIYDQYALPIDIDGLKPTINQSPIAKALTKEDLIKIIREELGEALGIGGTDSVNFQQDDTANESKLDEAKLFADFSLDSDNSIESRFARSISEIAREYEHMDNIDIPGYFDEYEEGDDVYAGPTESLKFFQTLPDEFIVTNNIDDVEESFKIIKTGDDSFTAEEI